eukprot:TRINITY_DN11828_c0_g1_i1.p1 TRINITY_DN11828_c0_g1~~TRINITY_DN11828_c0_g1_i1.p1  ORF type:complete len:206 (+),score=47.04 TRINITY_DN11828_c0_g1_i1:89-706(+)
MQMSFKVVVLGSLSVGKTCITTMYVEGSFPQTKATIAASFLSKSLTLGDQKVILQIWDTAGQEKFKALTPMYYRNCSAALVVYDITKPESLEQAKYWVKELKSNENPFVIVLVGNKSDKLDKMKLEEFSKEGKKYAYEANLEYFTCSALYGNNINEIFDCIIKKLPITGIEDIIKDDNGNDIKPNNVDLENDPNENPNKCVCQIN